MFTIEVDDHAVKGWLTAMPDKVRQRLEYHVNLMAQKLLSHVVRDKLMGQVLNRVTGALGRSIQETVTTTATSVTGKVYSAGDVVYGRIHEYGETVTRRVSQAWGRPMKNPRDVVFHYPERSFMRTSLADYKDEIIQHIKQGVAEGLQP